MADFEVFARTHARQARGPTLTVTVRGTLNLNAAAWEMLGEPETVELLYARAERTIGLRPVAQDAPSAYLVRPIGNGRTRMVSAKSFCTWIEADLSAGRRYPLTMAEGVGCVNLSRPAQVVKATGETRLAAGGVGGRLGGEHRREEAAEIASYGLQRTDRGCLCGVIYFI